MTNLEITIAKIHQLPEPQLEQLNDFIDFLLMKLNQNPIASISMATKSRPRFGSAKGTMTIAADFDEPLEEFREYME